MENLKLQNTDTVQVHHLKSNVYGSGLGMVRVRRHQVQKGLGLGGVWIRVKKGLDLGQEGLGLGRAGVKEALKLRGAGVRGCTGQGIFSIYIFILCILLFILIGSTADQIRFQLLWFAMSDLSPALVVVALGQNH